MSGPWGTEPDSGSRIGPTIRVGNKLLRDIQAADRLLEIVCPDGGSRRQPRLVAVVTKDMTLEIVNTPLAQAGRGRVYTPCRCALDLAEETDAMRERLRAQLESVGADLDDAGPVQSRGHFLDVAKVLAAVERLRYQPRKARRVDVGRVAAE